MQPAQSDCTPCTFKSCGCQVLCGSQQLLLAEIQQGIAFTLHSLVSLLVASTDAVKFGPLLHPVGSVGTSSQPASTRSSSSTGNGWAGQPLRSLPNRVQLCWTHCSSILQSELSCLLLPGKLSVASLASLAVTLVFAALGKAEVRLCWNSL